MTITPVVTPGRRRPAAGAETRVLRAGAEDASAWSGRRPGRGPWVLGCAAAAGWAVGFPLVSRLGTQQVWGTAAGVGYGLAGAAALLLPRRRVAPVAVAIALAGALVLPYLVMRAMGTAQSEVRVVQDSARLLLRTGSPYLAHPVSVTDYHPYFPAMALFGLLGDPRLWFLGVFVASLVGTWYLLRPSGVAGGRAGGPAVPLGALVASPLVALPAAVGGVDLPIIGLCCLGLALAARRWPVRAALVLALACGLKWTAWPAAPVALLTLHQVAPAGRRGAELSRFASAAAAGTAAIVLPAAVRTPRAMLEQVVLFPLGLAGVRTPASSPMPGHLLADLGPGGRTAALGLLAAAAVASVCWLAVRPPRGAVQAADRLAVGLAAAFLLAPAGRFGYLGLPAVLLVWPRVASFPSPAGIRAANQGRGELRAQPAMAPHPATATGLRPELRCRVRQVTGRPRSSPHP